VVVDETLAIEQSLQTGSSNSMLSVMKDFVDNFKQLFVVWNCKFQKQNTQYTSSAASLLAARC